MRHPAAQRVLIAGAGVGGLVTAIALRRAGFEVSVFERASELVEVGAGLTLWANAMTSLRRIGCGHILESVGKPIRASHILSWRGDTLAEMPLDALARRFGVPMVATHRAELQAALLAEAGPDVVRTGAACTSFHQHDAQVWAHLASGEQIPGDLLIGADGIRSSVRAQLFGAPPPRYAGYTAWRGVVSLALPQWDEAIATETWGAGMRFGLVPLTGGRFYWFATMNAPEGARDTPGGRKRELLDRFSAWHDPIPAVIAATDEVAILRNDIYDRPPIASWSRGRVALLGDAAHATTPNMGQGACQAMEDAVALVAHLGAADTLASALHAYEAQRVRRANAITRQSLRLGQVGQWENRWAVAARDAAFRALPASMLGRSLATALQPA